MFSITYTLGTFTETLTVGTDKEVTKITDGLMTKKLALAGLKISSLASFHNKCYNFKRLRKSKQDSGHYEELKRQIEVLKSNPLKVSITKLKPIMADLTLPDAIEKAKLESRSNKGTVLFINVDEDGWCHVDKLAELGATSHAFKNGNEIAVPNGYAIGKGKPVLASQIKKKSSKKAAKPDADESGTTSKVMTTKTKVKKAAKKVAKVKVEGTTRGNNMKLTTAQWGKVDARLKKDDVSFSSFSRGLVLKAIGE